MKRVAILLALLLLLAGSQALAGDITWTDSVVASGYISLPGGGLLNFTDANVLVSIVGFTYNVIDNGGGGIPYWVDPFDNHAQLLIQGMNFQLTTTFIDSVIAFDSWRGSAAGFLYGPQNNEGCGLLGTISQPFGTFYQGHPGYNLQGAIGPITDSSLVGSNGLSCPDVMTALGALHFTSWDNMSTFLAYSPEGIPEPNGLMLLLGPPAALVIAPIRRRLKELFFC